MKAKEKATADTHTQHTLSLSHTKRTERKVHKIHYKKYIRSSPTIYIYIYGRETELGGRNREKLSVSWAKLDFRLTT